MEQTKSISHQPSVQSLRRKPVPARILTRSISDQNLVRSFRSWDEESPPPLPPRIETLPNGPLASAPGSVRSHSPGATPVDEKSSGPSTLSKAWEETKYFAGGLIPHPVESTKHHSVLRHSHGLVYYQGPETSLAISVFSDRPLPADRRLWLQQKGWTGNTGWAAKRLFGANGGWLDVTPVVEATAEQLSSSCDRAWMRDCEKFLKKDGAKLGHTLRETCILRIPAEAEDGYFRIVLCGHGKPKKRLCPSPMFRIMSMSTAPSSIKGASLATLPLEAGIKVLSIVANNYATAAVRPATGVITKVAGKYMPDFWQKQVANVTYDMAELQNKIKKPKKTSKNDGDTGYQHIDGVDQIVLDALDRAPVAGDDSGPQVPYPIRFASSIVAGTGQSGRKHGTPTANLKHVSEEVATSLNGIYFGWARIMPSKDLVTAIGPQADGFFPTWHPALIYASVVTNMPTSVMYGARKQIDVHFIHNFDSCILTGSKIETIIMGFLRRYTAPPKAVDLEDADQLREQSSSNIIADIAITEASLVRPAWAVENAYQIRGWRPERTEVDEKTGKVRVLSRSITDRYADARQAAQRQVNRAPVHLMGIRRDVDHSKSQAIGNGGIYVRRG